MNQFSSINVNPKDFSRLPAARFYLQMMRSQSEYGLAINTFTSAQAIQRENTQKHCLRTIFGGSSYSFVNIIMDLINPLTMKERINILKT
ncbi:hypothetical protein G6F51_014755 [Rhizopus arrhizus]|nr:hypothetical protein G6F51_014755 [Rhizopus arrhizus]